MPWPPVPSTVATPPSLLQNIIYFYVIYHYLIYLVHLSVCLSLSLSLFLGGWDLCGLLAIALVPLKCSTHPYGMVELCSKTKRCLIFWVLWDKEERQAILDWGSYEGYEQAMTQKLILGQVTGAGSPDKGT